MYKEYKPNSALLPYIETYWATSGHLIEKINQRILPDGCVDILFSFKYSVCNHLAEGIPYIIGTMTSFSDLVHEGQIEMIGIRFRPVGITAFLSEPINELTDKKIEVNIVDSVFERDFYLKLTELDNTTLRLQYIDTYLYSRLAQIKSIDKRIIFATELIKQTNGLIALTDVAERSCMSLRNFERIFKRSVGISAKKFQKITRFNYTRKYIKQNPKEDLLIVAIHCGYYDHAHLIHDFKTLSGNSPVTYR